MSETIYTSEFVKNSTINELITCRFCNKKEHVKAWSPFGTMKIYLCSECLDLLERHCRQIAWELIKKLMESGYFEVQEE
jgi:hypothetical protein